jgi:hypothetical protein
MFSADIVLGRGLLVDFLENLLESVHNRDLCVVGRCCPTRINSFVGWDIASRAMDVEVVVTFSLHM